MKFLAMCSTGLGSSFMVRMNIETIVRELDLPDITVEHSDISSAGPDSADVFFVAKDLEDAAHGLGDVVVLNSIIDMDELREAVKSAAARHGLV
ncbi:PTS sugar transporter subunit IIB [Streptomyces griseoviridis]|uniref:PTS lactose transporter subunit IIB n=2 Tax=Streptomyces TaxID=1883 RepID=A0A3S9Z5E5_STRGD|nr:MULTISPECIES: PTS sugar transporter subunit IIB [Streptomyces]AZS82918.1 PTS sugar transporter subunit IIB [Streptomyces griseoviridis]MDH6695606.1 PTS system ascorbate-specific IIB component [Streptomyces sp. MAA16]MDT0470753.1 PTS sugar transporter subunit IIB [Streptomyces sp. DSM 41014]QCN90232.1 PTS lactose transporter subunit IIB [Streptomyces griseoviridis]